MTLLWLIYKQIHQIPAAKTGRKNAAEFPVFDTPVVAH